MKTRLLIIIGIVLIFVFVTPYSFASHGNADLILTWSQANYRITNGTGIATIIVNDSDKNEISFFVEEVNVFVYSDSFAEGITLTLYETEKNSGIFERTFSFSDSRSAPNILFVSEGDTATVIYTDNPLPADYLYQTIDFTATTLIGSTGPPIERVPASNARITDIQGNILGVTVVDEQALLTSDIANQMTRNQTFAWLVQVTDSNKKVQALSWIEGTLNPKESFSPTTSWIPKKEGYYNVVFFVWESITNPSALSPPISIDFEVIVPVTPEPPSFSLIEHNLIDAKKLLQIAYYENVNLGPLKINEVIVGFGIENYTMIMDVLYRYSTSSEMDIVKKKIRNIVGDEIKIEYIPSKESRLIQKTLVYHWNDYLHKNNIEFAPAYPSHGNNDDGIGDGTFLCSPLVAPNGTEFYIVSTIIVEPFLITDTFIDIEKPEFCRKTWKTDVILEEPGRVISLWLEMGQGKIPN